MSAYASWAGGPQPEGVEDEDLVEVVFRNGQTSARPRPAKRWEWRHNGLPHPWDIVAWRRPNGGA